MQYVIEVRNLKKSYGKVQAVKGISFEVKSGSMFAFLGPNGAGKSTTIDALCTLTKYDEGQIEIAGFWKRSVRVLVWYSRTVFWTGIFLSKIICH